MRASAEQMKVATIFGIFGLSGVRAIPVVAGSNEGSYYLVTAVAKTA